MLIDFIYADLLGNDTAGRLKVSDEPESGGEIAVAFAGNVRIPAGIPKIELGRPVLVYEVSNTKLRIEADIFPPALFGGGQAALLHCSAIALAMPG